MVQQVLEKVQYLKNLSTKLNYHYLDSGAIYRVIAYAAKKENIESGIY